MKKKLFNFIQIFFLFFLFFLSFNYTNSFGACPTGANPNVTVSSDFQCKEGFIDINGDIKSSISFNITNNSTYYLQTYVDGSSPYTITKTGNGTLTFMDTNISNFSASTIISDGTVSVSDNNTLGTGTIILNGGALSSFNTSARTLANSIQVQNSSTLGNTTNSGALTLSGDITFTDKNLTLTSNSNNTISNIDLGGQPNTLSIATGVTSTVSGNITNGTLTKSGSGSLVVSGNMTSNSPLVVGAGTLEIGGTLTSGNFTNTISNDGTFSINSSSNQILSGNISGAGALTKSGSSTLTLSGTNTYSGSTTINAGTISVASSANLGATPGSVDADNIIFNGGTLNTTADFTLGANKGITMTGAGTIDTDASTTLTYAGSITDSGVLTKSGTGTLSLSGTSDNSGGISVSAGTLISSSASGLGSGTVTVDSGASLKIDSTTTKITVGNNLNIVGSGISGETNTGALLVDGLIDLTGKITISGDTTITKNYYISGNSGPAGDYGDFTVNVSSGNAIENTNAADSETVTFNIVGNSKGKIILEDAISLAGASSGIIKQGYGELQLKSADNSYSGSLTISQGSVRLSGSGALPSGSSLVMNGGILYLDNSSNLTLSSLSGNSTSSSISLNNSGSSQTLTIGDSNNTTYAGRISDYAMTNDYLTVEKVGTGTLTLTNNNGSWAGGSQISAGKIEIGNDGSLGTGTITLNGGTLSSNSTTARTLDEAIAISASSALGDSTNTGKITLSGNTTFSGTNTLTANSDIELSGSIDLGSATQTFSVASGKSATLSGAISSGAISKSGDGTLIISADNDYASGTSVSAGTLRVSGSGDLGTGSLTIGASGSLDLRNTLSVASLEISGAGSGNRITNGDADGTTANLTVSGTSTLNGAVNTDGTQTYSGTTTLGSDVSLTGSTVSLAAISGGTNALAISGNLDLNGAASSLTTLSVSGTSDIGADVTTTGSQTYSGATTFSASSTLIGSTVNFGSTVDGGNNNIIISGNADIDGAITNTAALSVQGVGSTSNIGADITTTGVQFLGNATLSGDGNRTVTSTGGDNITFYGITGASKGLTVDGGFQLSTNDATGLASLSVTGASTLAANVTSTGTQSYDGTTTLSSGDRTLTASTVTLNAVTGGSNALTVTGNLDLDGAVSGVTNMSVSGTSNIGSNVTTTGTQNYQGATTLSGGDRTLQGSTITMAAVTGTGSHDLTVTGNLDLDGAVTNVVELDITGTSNLGANVTTSGTQNYQGTTTLSGGDRTLQGSTITMAAVTGGSNALTVTGNLDLDGAVSGVTNMSVSGTSNIGADVTTTGTQSYTGTTTVSASSTLIGTEISAAAIALNDDLEIRNSSDSTLASVISGTGALTKSGSGALTLRGVNTFDGDLTVSAGTLFAGLAADSGNQVIENNVIVSGGTLSGGATIGGNVTVATANLAPGNSIGTLTIDGNVTLGDNSTTTIEFNDTTSDKIVVSGNITLAGALVLEPANTTYSDVTLTIFDGSGGSGNSLSGTFASTTVNNSSNLGDATTSISYDTVNRKVFLNIDEDGGVSSNTVKSLTTKNNFKDIAEVFDAATTGKTLEVANVLKASDSNSVNTELGKLKGTVLATTFTQPTLNHNNFNRALTSVTSSNVNTSLVSSFTSSSTELTLASLQDAGLYRDKKNFNEYFDYSDTSVLGFVKNNKNRSIFNDFQSEDSATFIRTYGTTADRDNINSNYTGYDSETTGILFGQQFKNDEETFTGYSYGFTGTDTDYKNNYGESKTYSVHASLFKQYDKKDHGLNLISGMYVSKTESERNVSVFGTSVNDKYVSDYWDVGVNQEVQYIKKYKFGEVSVSPSAKLNSTYVFKSDTEETGGELALNVDNDNLLVVKPELGISIGVDLSKKDNINNELSLAMFASQDHFIDGTTSNARYSSGSSFNVDLPRDQETYYSLGLGYNFLNKETDTSLMANAFLMQNEDSDMNSNIFSLTFRKLFGDFAKGNVPPVIAKKPENDQEVIKEASPKDKNSIKKVEKTLEEFEENIEIVLKESPTEQEVAKVYESISNNSKIKRQLTLNDVYNNLSANCYAIENKLVHLVNYYDKQQLYKILDKCNKLSDPKIHLIANRLHQIQQDETTAYQKIYTKYLRILSYVPFVTFVAFIILAYEFIRRYIVNHFRAKNTI